MSGGNERLEVTVAIAGILGELELRRLTSGPAPMTWGIGEGRDGRARQRCSLEMGQL